MSIWRFSKGYESVFGGRECSLEDRDKHVYSEIGIRPDGIPDVRECECGRMRLMRCECSDCHDFHIKAVPTSEEDRLNHELYRVHRRIDALEKRGDGYNPGADLPDVDDRRVA